MVVIGVQPRSVTDINSVVKNLDEAFTSVKVQVDLSGLPNQVAAAKPDAFVEIVTLRKEVYDTIANKLNSTPGVVTRNSTQPWPTRAQFARALIGTSGEVTKEIMDKNPGKYKIGDVVGLAGLQQQYDDPLRASRASPSCVPMPTGYGDEELFTSRRDAGRGDQAHPRRRRCRTRPRRRSPSTPAAPPWSRSGSATARSSRSPTVPARPATTSRSSAQTPPGSTFKTITALGRARQGHDRRDRGRLPEDLTVDGRTFKNSHDKELGNVPFRVDFAKSCNTAFASLAPKLAPDGLAKTAQTRRHRHAVGPRRRRSSPARSPANGSQPSRPRPRSARAPRSLARSRSPAPPPRSPAAVEAAAAGARPGPEEPRGRRPAAQPASLDALRQMMREVVTAGTADQLKDLPGDLRGKHQL